MGALLRLALIAVVFAAVISDKVLTEEVNTLSPDQSISIKFMLDDDGAPYYSVSKGGITFLDWSRLGLSSKGDVLPTRDFKIVSVSKNTIDETYPVVSGKSSYARNNCIETKILLEERSDRKRQLEFYFRAYDDGAALRYGIPAQNSFSDFVISNEATEFNFGGDYTCWALKTDRFRNSYEGQYIKNKFSTLYNMAGDSLGTFPYITLPITIEVRGNLYVMLSEAAITNYPGMYLYKGSSGSFKSKLSPHLDDAMVAVTGKAPAVSPWRMFIICRSPGELIQSNLVMNLNEPSKVPDASSWVKPGKSAWGWWAEDRGFEPSFGFAILSTNTVKYYVDFASQNSIEYITLDGGWYGWFDASKENESHDLTKTLPELDLPYIADYAASKGVGIFLWVVWHDLEKQMDAGLDYYQRLGIKGIKMDFMERDDQYMVNFYHRVADECAKRKILVNFHGSYKPDGLMRTYPNIITYEAVLGNEYARWITGLPKPDYNVTIPFTRMPVGPMDYTPGSMVNSTNENYIGRWKNSMTKGTRMSQIAMTVVYESGLITLCESPKLYENLPEFEFIRQVPATWDQTIVLGGEIGEYIVITRKKNNKWFIGGMTNWQERNVKINFSFLDAGQYQAAVYSDGDDANTNPQSVKIIQLPVSNSDIKSFSLAKGGGLAIILTKTP